MNRGTELAVPIAYAAVPSNAMVLVLLIVAVLFLAWSNGANDNFKGVATLYGSRTASFRNALVWATATTVAGSLVSVALASALATAFSGKGLVPDALVEPRLLVAVGGAGAVTILVATAIGMPTSTTHALTGALVGAGLMAAGSTGIAWGTLTTKFAQPLLLSPLLAIGGAAIAYRALRWGRLKAGIDRMTCVCVGTGRTEVVPLGSAAAAALEAQAPGMDVEIGRLPDCVERYSGRVLGLDAQRLVDLVHYLSAGAVCFARAVNDTPKIAALLLAAIGLQGSRLSTGALAAVALAMALGGWIQSRKVAETMSRRITDLNPGQGLTSNLTTAALVLGASRLGLPVSTTHVSCGSIFGIGLATGKGNARTIAQILVTWATTLPFGLALGAFFYWLLA